MAKNTWQAVIHSLSRSVQPGGAESDGDLLEQFVREGQQAPFAVRVRRHGPMVFGVCRRLLGDAHDAEDAFQATFLILFRKAGVLGRTASLANWLYTVAVRVALRVKASAGRRREQERHAAVMASTEAPAVDEGLDLRPVLDEELYRLAAKYREPLVLCYLQGKSNEEAAQHLGCPVGTVYTRLSRGRDLLRDRLERRGMTLSVALVGAALAEQARADVPVALLDATVEAVSVLAAGQAATAVSAPVVALTESVLRGMELARMRAIAVIITIALVLTGSGWFVHRAVAVKPDEPLVPGSSSRDSEPSSPAAPDELVAVPGNVALAANDVKVSGIEHGAIHLNDGRVTGFQRYASSPWPCEWIIELPRAYPLTTVRLLLWDGNDRYYRYVLEASADGMHYEVLADRSTGKWRSWQTITFTPRPVKFLKVKGLYNSENAAFHLKELEAYCLPPDKPVTPLFPSEP